MSKCQIVGKLMLQLIFIVVHYLKCVSRSTVCLLSKHCDLLALTYSSCSSDLHINLCGRVATVRGKVLENEKNSRSGKSPGITFSVREI